MKTFFVLGLCTLVNLSSADAAANSSCGKGSCTATIAELSVRPAMDAIQLRPQVSQDDFRRLDCSPASSDDRYIYLRKDDHPEFFREFYSLLVSATIARKRVVLRVKDHESDGTNPDCDILYVRLLSD